MFHGNTYNILDVLNNILFNAIPASRTFFKTAYNFTYFIFRNWDKIKSINSFEWNVIWWFLTWWWNRLGYVLPDIDKEIVKVIAYHITIINNTSIAMKFLKVVCIFVYWWQICIFAMSFWYLICIQLVSHGSVFSRRIDSIYFYISCNILHSLYHSVSSVLQILDFSLLVIVWVLLITMVYSCDAFL